MTMSCDATLDDILRLRLHGLYLTRGCGDLMKLSRDIMGLHCWFSRNVPFSALIRGADIASWKTKLTKTWLYRGTLHGVDYDDLPNLLSLNRETDENYTQQMLGSAVAQAIQSDVVSLMSDGVFSRAEMRGILADKYDKAVIDVALSPWGGVFVSMARRGEVAFRSMVSRDFDLIDNPPTMTREEAIPYMLGRYFAAYGPATLDDAMMFLGLAKENKKIFDGVDLGVYNLIEYNKKKYYHTNGSNSLGDIPRLMILSGFDPLVVSYVDRTAIMPLEYRSLVVLKSGICNPTIAIDGKIAGTWNVKNNRPIVTFFDEPAPMIRREAVARIEDIIRRVNATKN